MSAIALIGVDWGSSSVRAFAIASDGGIVDMRRAPDGALTGAGAFDQRLGVLLGDWLVQWPDAPVLLCGMVGSDRGWVRAPYVAAPAGLDDLANALTPVPFGRSANIVPGISLIIGETCEVMRGEETLLMGLAETAPHIAVCLPGTHSKWAEMADGRVAAFRTHMTGELRALLLATGALATPVAQTRSTKVFLEGLAASIRGTALAQALFQARARRMLGALAAEHAESFVSGVLVGEEIRSEAAIAGREGAVILAARGPLAEEYGAALAHAGLAFTLADPEALAALGLLRIARRAALCPIGSA